MYQLQVLWLYIDEQPLELLLELLLRITVFRRIP